MNPIWIAIVAEFNKMPHHAQITYALATFLFILNLVIKIALWLHPIADWVALAQKRPRLAALLRLSLALGINPISVLQSIVDIVRNAASPGTVASMQAFKVSASAPLIASKSASLHPPKL
jgi:hypothetical protein